MCPIIFMGKNRAGLPPANSPSRQYAGILIYLLLFAGHLSPALLTASSNYSGNRYRFYHD